MTHLSEEQLIAYRYGETKDRRAIEEHLGACEACRASFQTFERVLAAVNAAPVPERDDAYGSRIWQRIRPRLAERTKPSWSEWLLPRRLVATAAVAAIVVAAFLAGRYWPGGRVQPPSDSAIVEPVQAREQVRERILLVAVGDHLDRSQMVLLELVNAPSKGTSGKDGVDISSEQQRAEDLVAANRLYRQTATSTGDAAMASVLDELERALLEIAHSPAKVTPKQLDDLRKRIEARGILFKVRVVGMQVREREKSAAQTRAGGSS